MGTEIINQATIHKVVFLKRFNQVTYEGRGELSFKRGAYSRMGADQYLNAFIEFGARPSGAYDRDNDEDNYRAKEREFGSENVSQSCFAYFTRVQLTGLHQQIGRYLEDDISDARTVDTLEPEEYAGDEITPKQALEILESGGTVWLKDYAENPEDYGGPDYPVEDPEDIHVMMEDGYFEGDDPVVILAEPSGA